NNFGSWLIAITISLPLMVYPQLVGVIVGKLYDKEALSKVVGFALVSTLIISYKQGISRDLIFNNKMCLSVFSIVQCSFFSIFIFSIMENRDSVGLGFTFCISYLFNLIFFVPFFIKMKITPRYLFYNFYVCSIWIILLILIFINIYCSNYV